MIVRTLENTDAYTSPRTLDLDFLSWGPGISILLKLVGLFQYTAKFENHWSRLILIHLKSDALQPKQYCDRCSRVSNQQRFPSLLFSVLWIFPAGKGVRLQSAILA